MLIFTILVLVNFSQVGEEFVPGRCISHYYQSRKRHLCNLAKYISRLSVMTDRTKALNESHVCSRNQLEKLHYRYERLNLNGPFQQMNETCSQNLAPSLPSVSSKSSGSSKSKSRLGTSNASRKELVKAELLADQAKINAERES